MKAEEDELSDEDKQLKEELELCVTRLGVFKTSYLLNTIYDWIWSARRAEKGTLGKCVDNNDHSHSGFHHLDDQRSQAS